MFNYGIAPKIQSLNIVNIHNHCIKTWWFHVCFRQKMLYYSTYICSKALLTTCDAI